MANKNEIIFELFSEESLRNLINKSETIRGEINEWEKECREIKDSCKIFNDSLMIIIIADEKIINSSLYDEINKINKSIDLIGEDLKQKFKEEQKWDKVAQNEKDILLFFNSDKKNHALVCVTSISDEISILVSKIRQLWIKLIEYTGGYKCVPKYRDNHFHHIPSLLRHILFKNEKLSEVLKNITCKSSEYKCFLDFCLDSKLYKNLSIVPHHSCYVEPTVQYKQSELRSQLRKIVSPVLSSPIDKLRRSILSKQATIIELPERPNSVFELKKGHRKESINLLDKGFDIKIVRKVLDKKEQERAKIDLVKALASKRTDKTRSLGEKIKKDLQKQMRIINCCPYCEKSFDGDVPHADHIHPVSKGGLSISENMIYICSTCNTKKTNKTLTKFIKDNNLDRDKIDRNLELLKKTF